MPSIILFDEFIGDEEEFTCATIFFLKSKIHALLSSFFGADTSVSPIWQF